MGTSTGIEWCDATWNPWRGCAHPARHPDGSGEAPECLNCYAEAGSNRNRGLLGSWGPGSARVVGAESYWDLPRKWAAQARRDGSGRPRVFFASYADVFEDRPDLVPLRARAFSIIDALPELDFLICTKRPECVPRLWPGGSGVRRRNVWLGTTCGHPDSLWRVDALRRLGRLCELRFVSVEPLLSAIDFGPLLSGVSWVIVGGESGPASKVRPLDVAWVRAVAFQARRARAALFVKQLGSALKSPLFRCRDCGWVDDADGFGSAAAGLGGLVCERCHGGFASSPIERLLSPKGGDPLEWPEDLRIREFPAGAGVAHA